MSNDFTKIYILGAGCSVCGHYPVAKDVPARMKEFAQQLGPGASEIKRCVKQTVELMETLGVTTIDRLVQAYQHRDRLAVKEAKIATSAFFLWLEEHGAHSAYQNYGSLFEELFDYGSRRSLKGRAKTTPCRVLTYNYDRLFERTFMKWAQLFDSENAEAASDPLRFLNAGLSDIEEIQINTDRFAFLKLHGGTGEFYRDKDGGFRFPYWPRLGQEIPAVSDDPFYSRPGYKGDTPMIAFPKEKPEFELLHDPQRTTWSFNNYLSVVWKAARELCQRAVEINIIGCSLDFIDRPYFEYQLLQPAKHCRKIVIRNLESEKDHLLDTIERIKNRLEATWEIKYLAREF